MKTPKPTLYEHIETPGGTVYWKPHVDEGITVPEEGKSYDTIDEAIDMYSKYAEAGDFQIKKAGLVIFNNTRDQNHDRDEDEQSHGIHS